MRRGRVVGLEPQQRALLEREQAVGRAIGRERVERAEALAAARSGPRIITRCSDASER